MAISKPISKFGVIFDGVYTVSQVVASKQRNTITVSVDVSINGDVIDQEIHTFDAVDAIAGTNPIAQAYSLIKTLPEYTNSTDV